LSPSRALVTGGAGFIGSNLVDALIARGDEVLVVDDFSTGRRGNLAGAGGGVEIREADVADPTAFGGAVDGFDPDFIYHLAAQADVREAVSRPAFDARVNVIGTINALEAARRAGAVMVFAATGGAVYGEGDGRAMPLAEDQSPLPETPYGVSKLAGEYYVDLYRRLHSVPAVALRFANVYGPRQDPHGEAGVVAILCGRLLAGDVATVYGDGLQTRDYVYVEDTVAAVLAAADGLREDRVPISGPLNVGTGRETSVLKLVAELAEIDGVDFEVELRPERAGEIRRIALDSSAAAAQIGWRARTELRDGLAATLDSLRPEARPA
jgi:UDP-glucose 4-epimerase